VPISIGNFLMPFKVLRNISTPHSRISSSGGSRNVSFWTLCHQTAEWSRAFVLGRSNCSNEPFIPPMTRAGIQINQCPLLNPGLTPSEVNSIVGSQCQRFVDFFFSLPGGFREAPQGLFRGERRICLPICEFMSLSRPQRHNFSCSGICSIFASNPSPGPRVPLAGHRWFDASVVGLPRPDQITFIFTSGSFSVLTPKCQDIVDFVMHYLC
jgi:hypothetical protein